MTVPAPALEACTPACTAPSTSEISIAAPKRCQKCRLTSRAIRHARARRCRGRRAARHAGGRARFRPQHEDARLPAHLAAGLADELGAALEQHHPAVSTEGIRGRDAGRHPRQRRVDRGLQGAIDKRALGQKKMCIGQQSCSAPRRSEPFAGAPPARPRVGLCALSSCRRRCGCWGPRNGRVGRRSCDRRLAREYQTGQPPLARNL